MKHISIPALITGLLIGGGLMYLLAPEKDHLMHDSHYYGDGEDVHVHADFILHIDGNTIDLSGDEYMTTAERELHPSLHLHDNEGNIIHRHEEDVTLGAFFTSLGLPLTDECITFEETEYCSNDEQQLLFYVNDTLTEGVADYVLQDEDRLLIYYGAPDDPAIPELLSQIDDRACIFTGTCPERGVAPPESCGITCEI